MGHKPPQYSSSQTHYFNLGTPGTVHFQIDWSRRGGSKEAITGIGLYKREYNGWKRISDANYSWPWKPPNPITYTGGNLQPGEYRLTIHAGFTGFFDPWTNYPIDFSLNILTIPRSIYNSQIPLPIPFEEAVLQETKEGLTQVSAKFSKQALLWDNIKESVFKGWFGITDEKVSQIFSLRASLANLSSNFSPDFSDPDYYTVSPPTFYQLAPMEITDLELATSLGSDLSSKLSVISDLQAAKTALNRYQDAVETENTRQATYQFVAFWSYLKEATEALRENERGLKDLSQTFQEKGVPNFSFLPDDIAATQERLRVQGFLPEEIATFDQTGASPEEIEQARQVLLGVDPALAAGELYSLLEKERTEIRAMADSLEVILKRDTEPPSSFDLDTPLNNAKVDKKPIFSWSKSLDTGSSGNVSGLSEYELFIDGILERDNIFASQTSAIPVSSLSPGEHTWFVRVIDSSGNFTQSSTTRTFKVRGASDSLITPETITLLPTKDANINYDLPYYPRTDYSNYNYGRSPQMGLSSYSGETKIPRILMSFDLSSIPSDAIITSATLKLYCHYAGNGEETQVFRLTKSWIEGTGASGSSGPLKPADGVTWNTYDGILPWAMPGADIDLTESYGKASFIKDETGWKSWDITELAAGWLTGPNYGLMLASISSGSYYGVGFYSREYSDPSLLPRLEVSYALAAPPIPKLISNVFVEPSQFDPYEKDTGQTTIHYTLEKESLVSMEILNSKEKVVKEKLPRIGKAPGEPGENTVAWNGIIDFPELNKDTSNASDRSVFIAPNDTYTIKITAVDVNDLSLIETQEVKVKVRSTF